VDAELAWLLVAVALIVGEVFTLAVVLGLLGVGALAAAVLALVGVGLAGQALAFAAASTALLVFVRPSVQRAIARGEDGTRTDARMLTGSRAVVVERVTEESGQVRLNGELWRARPYAGTGPVEVGQSVSVAAVQGATVLVYSPDLS
jgi:membrane protein implicated in regulation of membrane protease activity